MKNKEYVEKQLETADAALSNVMTDVDNNRPYVTKEYLMERLEYIQKVVMLAQDRVQLEDESY